MKPNCSTANRTSVRVKSSPRSLRSTAASRGSETLCRPSLPTAGGGTAVCAATAKCITASAKWCADSANAPAAVNHSPVVAMHGPSVAADAGRVSAASANASTGAAVQTPTPAAADAAPAVRSTSDDGPSAAPARPSAIDGAAAKKTSASAGALTAERRATAVAAGVVLRSADDRTALFTQWLAPHLPMVRGLVRRHTYFAGERADDYQTAVLHLLEHLDDLAHFALCLTARRDTAKPHAATANRPAPADEPSAQPTTSTARDFDETRATVDESTLYSDKRAPYLYASTAEIDESAASLDESLRGDDEDLRTIDAAAVAFSETSAEDNESLRGDDDEPLCEVDETLPANDEALRTIDAAAGNFDAMTDADDEPLREANETQPDDEEALREVDETAVVFDETAAEDVTRAAAEDERQPYADAAPDESERTPAPLPVTAEEVLRTVGDFNPRPWLAGVTLRLLSTLNHRALRHRETHLTPASADSDELFDPADPDGDLWAVGADTATAGAQRQTAPSRWEETLGAGRERTGGSEGVTTREAAATRTAQAASAHVPDERAPSPTAASAAPSAGAEEATTAGGGPTATGEWAGRAVDDCLECWHREQPRRGFHRTRGGRLWNAMRARAQQAHSAFAYRAVLRADAVAALAAQPLRDRALVLLTADGWTAEEIGLAVGASPTAVRQTVCRVRTRLRRWRKAWARRTHATRAL